MSYNAEQMRVYTNEYRRKRREDALNRLGGECSRCSSTESLEFDHVDPSSKYLTIAKMWTSSKELFEAELKKCQLLCKTCHNEKSSLEAANSPAWNKGKWVHGSITAYYGKGCRCDPCRKAASEYRKRARLAKKANVV